MRSNIDGFVLHAIKHSDRVQVYTDRELKPMELMEVVANIVQLIPDEMRDVACNVVLDAVKEKEGILM